MSLLLRTHFQLAKTSIRENKTRSFLTCLGIAIGVASIILILSLMGSISNVIADQVSDMGADLIVVRPSSTEDTMTSIVKELTSSNSYQKSNLSLDDIETIENIEGVSAAAPVAIASNKVITDKNTVDTVTILGTNEEFVTIQPLALRYGSFISEQGTNTVVIGHTLSLVLFNTTNPVGKTLTIMGEKLMVVGVLSEVAENTLNFNNVDYDNAIIMHAETLAEISGSVQVQQINIKAANTDSLETVSNEIEAQLLEKKSGDHNFTVAYGDEITHPASSMFTIVSGILSLVAGISLVVGGIGVMNIMLVAVAERTHEIGIRKAVGASAQNILMQFLFEALILSFLGGILGLVLGYVLALIVSIITPFAPFLSWEILGVTFVTVVAVGIIFGIYPAIKAAAKNPIESLKHYR